MSKMMFELEVPFAVAKAKEDLGINNLWKYLRYIRMFIERTAMYVDKVNISYQVYNILLWNGVVAFCKDKVLGLVVGKVVDGKKDANGNYVEINFEGENGYKRKNLKVDVDCVLIYADATRIPPVIYLWAIANEVITREDIIRTQDNMLRKPILVDGIGEDLDNAMVKTSNVLSGVAFINKKGSKKGNVMDSNGLEVLNLQVGNSYKGAELWASRKNYEELICDYLGYTTVKNEKRERMNTTEVNNENSVGMTFYESYMLLQRKGKEDIKRVLGFDVEIVELIKKPEEKEESENVGSKVEMD